MHVKQQFTYTHICLQKTFIHMNTNAYIYKYICVYNLYDMYLCDRYGWVNMSSDRLVCLNCRNSLSHALSDTSGVVLHGRLQSAHQETCPWGQQGNGGIGVGRDRDNTSPVSFLSPPHTECMESVLEVFAQRLRRNWMRLLPLTSSSSSSSSCPLTLQMIGQDLTVPRESAGKDSLSVMALLTGRDHGVDCRSTRSTSTGSVALAEYLFQLLLSSFKSGNRKAVPASGSGDGSGGASDSHVLIGAQRESVLQALREAACNPGGAASGSGSGSDHATPSLLVAFCLAVQCSLLGLEVGLGVGVGVTQRAEGEKGVGASVATDASTAAAATAATGESLTLSLCCPLCQVTTKHALTSAPTSALMLSRCHRTFCPHVTGYTLPADPAPVTEGGVEVLTTATTTASTVPLHVPPGWLLSLECLLAVSLGVEEVERLLGANNMFFCLPDPPRQHFTHSRQQQQQQQRGGSGSEGEGEGGGKGVEVGNSRGAVRKRTSLSPSSRQGSSEVDTCTYTIGGLSPSSSTGSVPAPVPTSDCNSSASNNFKEESEEVATETPFNVYKKIKFMLDSS